jgi:hypothetical protein
LTKCKNATGKQFKSGSREMRAAQARRETGKCEKPGNREKTTNREAGRQRQAANLEENCNREASSQYKMIGLQTEFYRGCFSSGFAFLPGFSFLQVWSFTLVFSKVHLLRVSPRAPNRGNREKIKPGAGFGNRARV